MDRESLEVEFIKAVKAAAKISQDYAKLDAVTMTANIYTSGSFSIEIKDNTPIKALEDEQKKRIVEKEKAEREKREANKNKSPQKSEVV